MSFYYISTEMYSQNDSDEKIVLFLVTANQRREQRTFASEKTSFAASDWTNDVSSLVKSDRTGTTSLLARKLASRLFIFKMSVIMSVRFRDVSSIG